MEPVRRKFDRLVTALDHLVSTEAETFAARDFRALQEVQGRTGSVVAALAALDPAVLDAKGRARIASLLSRRQHTIELLESQLATARAELQALDASTQRVARIAPVYGQPKSAGPAARFTATG